MLQIKESELKNVSTFSFNFYLYNYEKLKIS